MTVTAKALLGYLIVVLIVATWMLRYEASGSGQGGSTVLDRWTGTVYYCFGDCVAQRINSK